MNDTDVLDLDYADPPPSPSLLRAARRRGRARRRRRQAAGATAVVVVAALAGFLAAPSSTGGLRDRLGLAGPADPRPSAPATSPVIDLSTLPFSTGSDPSARYTGTSDSAPIAWPVDGQGAQLLSWFEPHGRARMCFGQRASTSARTETLSCTQLPKAPAEGLWLNAVLARGEHGYDLEAPDPVDTQVFGAVRGEVSRVVVDLPRTGPVDAHLSPAPDDLGTVYWLSTRDFTIDGKVVGSPRPEQNFPLAVTVYRGDTPVFHCAGLDCWNHD